MLGLYNNTQNSNIIQIIVHIHTTHLFLCVEKCSRKNNNNTFFWLLLYVFKKMHNLSNKIPQCSELYGGCLEKYYLILPAGSRGGLREIYLYILKGGEIQYSSDGNWIVPDTTCLSLLSFIFSFPLSPFLSRSICSLAADAVISPPIFVTTDFFHQQWLTLPRISVHDTNRLLACHCMFKYYKNVTSRNWEMTNKGFPKVQRTFKVSLKFQQRFYCGIVKLRANSGWWLRSHLHYSEAADGLTFPYSQWSWWRLDIVAQTAEPSAWVCVSIRSECVPQGPVLLKAPIDSVSK